MGKTFQSTTTREPRRPQVYWNHLGRQLKLWRGYKISDAHALKLLRLWLGYEFTDLMDSQGRYPLAYYNEIRQRLGFAKWKDLIDDIRRCQSFYLIGTNSDRPEYISSPIWHEWNETDGPLQMGSIQVEKSQEMSQDFDESKEYSNEYNTKDITTVGTDEVGERNAQARRNEVRGYLQWMEQQTDADHTALHNLLMDRIRNPRDRKGQILQNQVPTDEQAMQMWRILLDRVLTDYLMKREQFFNANFKKHPERRIYWLNNLMKHWGKGFVVDARKIWRRQARQLEVDTVQQELHAMQQNRPISPYEWMDDDNVRWYTMNGVLSRIDADTEPRPSATAVYNFITKSWLEG